LLGAFQAILAHLRRNIHVRLARQVPFLLDDRPLLLGLRAMISNPAFLIGDDHLHAVGQDRRLQRLLISISIFRRQLYQPDRRRRGCAPASWRPGPRDFCEFPAELPRNRDAGSRGKKSPSAVPHSPRWIISAGSHRPAASFPRSIFHYASRPESDRWT